MCLSATVSLHVHNMNSLKDNFMDYQFHGNNLTDQTLIFSMTLKHWQESRIANQAIHKGAGIIEPHKLVENSVAVHIKCAMHS